LVDKRVDRPLSRHVTFVLPEGAARERRYRDHIKGLRSGPVASGTSFARIG